MINNQKNLFFIRITKLKIVISKIDLYCCSL